MKRSADFSHTVKHGVRAPQPDLVVHAYRDLGGDDDPKIGLIVAKSVGTAVDRHRVARRLRHVARAVLSEMGPAERVVVRALPGSRDAGSPRLEGQLVAAVQRAHMLMGRHR